MNNSKDKYGTEFVGNDSEPKTLKRSIYLLIVTLLLSTCLATLFSILLLKFGDFGINSREKAFINSSNEYIYKVEIGMAKSEVEEILGNNKMSLESINFINGKLEEYEVVIPVQVGNKKIGAVYSIVFQEGRVGLVQSLNTKSP